MKTIGKHKQRPYIIGEKISKTKELVMSNLEQFIPLVD